MFRYYREPKYILPLSDIIHKYYKNLMLEFIANFSKFFLLYHEVKLKHFKSQWYIKSGYHQLYAF